jgi:hypothetical protein
VGAGMKKKKEPEPELLADLAATVDFITAGHELADKDLPDHDALMRAVRLLPLRAVDALTAPTIEEREKALAKALLYAFTTGSYGTRSENTKFVSTAGGRNGKGKLIAERNRIADSIMQASPDKTVQQLQPAIAAEFERLGLGGAEMTYLYERKKRFRL